MYNQKYVGDIMEQLFTVENLKEFLAKNGYEWNGAGVLTDIRTSHILEPRVVGEDEIIDSSDEQVINQNMNENKPTTMYVSLKKDGVKKVLNDACLTFDCSMFTVWESAQKVLKDRIVRKQKSSDAEIGLNSSWQKFNQKSIESEKYQDILNHKKLVTLGVKRDAVSEKIYYYETKKHEIEQKIDKLNSQLRDINGQIEELDISQEMNK